jgi:predicted transcriptional regulator
MARLTINISDKLDKEMREYIEENNLTITTFLHLAISKYIESQEQQKKWKDLFTDLIKKELKKQNENT